MLPAASWPVGQTMNDLIQSWAVAKEPLQVGRKQSERGVSFFSSFHLAKGHGSHLAAGGAGWETPHP